MRLNIILYSFLLLCSTCAAKADSDNITKLNAMLSEMSREYSECAAIFLNFTMAEEHQSGNSAKLKDLKQKTYDTMFAATKFGEMAGQNPKSIDGNIAKMTEDFNKEIRQGNSNNKFISLGLKCVEIAEKPDEYFQRMKLVYRLQNY